MLGSCIDPGWWLYFSRSSPEEVNYRSYRRCFALISSLCPLPNVVTMYICWACMHFRIGCTRYLSNLNFVTIYLGLNLTFWSHLSPSKITYQRLENTNHGWPWKSWLHSSREYRHAQLKPLMRGLRVKSHNMWWLLSLNSWQWLPQQLYLGIFPDESFSKDQFTKET